MIPRTLTPAPARIAESAASWCVAIVLRATAVCARYPAFMVSFLVTFFFFYPALRNHSADAGFLYTGDTLGLYWPAMAKTQSLISSFNFTALDFSAYNGSSDYFLAPNFFVLHPLIVAYSLVFSTASTSMGDLGHFLVLLIALHCFLACYFSLKCLTRFFSLDFGSAALVATAFAFSINMIGAIGEPQFVFCIAVLPWAAYGALAFAESPGLSRLLAASVPIVFGFLGGYVPLGVTSVGLSLVLVATRLFAIPDGDNASLDRRLRRMLIALAPYLLASLVVAPYFYSVYRFLEESISADTPSLFYSAHQLAQYPHSLLKLLSNSLSVPGPFYEFSLSAGFIPIAVSLLFLFSRDTVAMVTPREWTLVKVSAVIYFAVVLSTFGEYSAVSDLVYYFVPQVGGMHIYQRFLLPAHLFLALIIAVMLRVVLAARPATATRVALAGYGAATLLVAYAVARAPAFAQDIGVDGYVLFELFLGLLFVVVLWIPGRGFIYVVTIILVLLPALNRMYDYSAGSNTLAAQRKLLPMALNDAEKARFVAYLKRFGDKQIIKYIDLTPLWDKDGREPFPKSMPYHVLNEVRLSSYHGFDFRMGPRGEYLTKMPMVVRDGTWVLSPNWEVVAAANADFIVAAESEIKSGLLGAMARNAGPDEIFRLPKGLVAVSLRGWVEDQAVAAPGSVDNGFFRISPAAPATAKPVNIARGKRATQSSTFAGHEAGLAVDGVTQGDPEAGSASHTDRDVNAWLEIDLGAVETIDSVGIWNVTGCCGFRLRDSWVFVSENPFKATDTAATLRERPATWGKVNSMAGLHSVIRTGGVRGQYVRVQLGGAQGPEDAYLHLAEVEVFARGKPDAVASRGSGAPDGKAKLLGFTTNDANYLRLEWESPGATTVQYLLSGNPRLRYYLNGEPARAIERGGLMSIDAPAGRNTLELKYRHWPMAFFWAVFAVYAAACLVAFARLGIQRRTE